MVLICRIRYAGWLPVTAEKGRTASVAWCRELKVSRISVWCILLPWKSPRCGTRESTECFAVSSINRNANAKHDADTYLSSQRSPRSTGVYNDVSHLILTFHETIAQRAGTVPFKRLNFPCAIIRHSIPVRQRSAGIDRELDLREESIPIVYAGSGTTAQPLLAPTTAPGVLTELRHL
jgi:hypothetical protein